MSEITQVEQVTASTSTGKWKAYPAYKVSGIEWLGEIPAHWEVRRLKYVAPISTQKLIEKPEDLPYIGLENIESKTGRLLLEVPIENVDSSVNVFQKGDVLFGKLRPYLTKVICVDFKGVCTTELLVLRPIDKFHARYIFYRLISDDFIGIVNAMTYGTKMPRANSEQIENLSIQLPSYLEQRAIAAFLDRETARIDTLIARKQRLIELLQEKRAALISHVVTKGLNPHARMKDSGVEWLGEIPAHWEVRRLKFVTSFVTSGSRGWAQFYSDEGALFIRIGNLSRNSIELDLNDVQRVVPPMGAEGERTQVKKNDVLISITAYIGSIAVVSQELGKAFVNQHIALTRPRTETINSRWLGYCLLSHFGQEQFQSLLYGGTKDGLGLDDVRNLFVLVPPLKEQSIIAEHLDYETAKLDALISRIREGIEKLQEYRVALISAAVTGKIDVREIEGDSVEI